MDENVFFTVWYGEWLILRVDSPFGKQKPNLNESTIARLRLRCEDLIRLLGWKVDERKDHFFHYALYLGEDEKICDIYP